MGQRRFGVIRAPREEEQLLTGRIDMTKERLRFVIGNNIRNVRVARDMSIDELSELLDLTSGFVGLIERGQRGATAYTLYKLSDIFNIPVDDIFAENIKLAEDSDSAVKVKRSKVISLLHNLSCAELDYLAESIKNLSKLRHELLGETQIEDDLDTDDL